MGTNYYMKRIPTEDDIQKIEKLARTAQFDELQEYVTEMNQGIHIGKRSCGWKFLFNHQDGKYFDSHHQELLKAWLNDPHYKIVDECGDEFTFEEFWQMTRDWDSHPNNNWDGSAYAKYEREQGNWVYNSACSVDEAERIFRRFGVRPVYHDFWLDGLRYSTSTEFC